MNNIQKTKRNLSKKAGLTLIELLVVLVILVAVGGLIVPTISSALGRSHVATCASTFPDVHNMIQRALLEGGSLGTDFESGIDSTGAAAGAAAGVNDTNVAAIDADEAAALAAAGITSVVDHDATADGYSVTFNIGGASRTLAASSLLVTLTDGQADAIYLPNGSGEKYVWFGIGPAWSLLGTVAPEPPAHFGDTPGFLPDEVHSRFGIVVQIADAGGTLDTAVFKRVSYSLGDTDGVTGADFETGDNHIGVYWEDINES